MARNLLMIHLQKKSTFGILAAIFLCCFCQQGRAFDAVNLAEPDKNLHAGISYNLAAAGTVSLKDLGYSNAQAMFISGGVVLLMGVLKEYGHDSHPDAKDIQADFADTVVGMTIPFRIEF